MPITKYFKAKEFPIAACANLTTIVANSCFAVKHEWAPKPSNLTMKLLSTCYIRA